jgi:hypothetical protein
MAEPITVPEKLKTVVKNLGALTKGIETVKKELAAPQTVPLTKIKPK